MSAGARRLVKLSVARFGHLDMCAQAELPNAHRADTPPHAANGGSLMPERVQVGVEVTNRCSLSEQLSRSGCKRLPIAKRKLLCFAQQSVILPVLLPTHTQFGSNLEASADRITRDRRSAADQRGLGQSVLSALGQNEPISGTGYCFCGGWAFFWPPARAPVHPTYNHLHGG